MTEKKGRPKAAIRIVMDDSRVYAAKILVDGHDIARYVTLVKVTLDPREGLLVGLELTPDSFELEGVGALFVRAMDPWS
jgi:hypothetical protein